MGLFPCTDVDRRFYEEKLRERLPARLIDIHTHVWLKEHEKGREDGGRTVTWPSRVAAQNPLEDIQETYRMMFPGKSVVPLMFGNLLSRGEDFRAGNAYVADCARKAGYPAFLFARPDWDANRLEKELEQGPFLGVKVYLSLSDPSIPRNHITILDFLPHHQLQVLDRRKLIVMLHVPRDHRIRDPKNVEQILLIADRYPDLKLIIAHAGRAYCDQDAGTAFKELAPARNVSFDVSANTNARVFEQLISTVGPSRVLFGSDLPITRMRMRRIEDQGRYVNLVPQGLYGDVSADPNMREVSKTEAASMTFFLYEEIAALLLASDRLGLTKSETEGFFFRNAAGLLKTVGFNL